jgi:tetratricopeptide (TPR) repeat protein
MTRAVILTVLLAAASAVTADEPSTRSDCTSLAPERRIAPCTAVIEAPDTPPAARAKAFFLRGLSYLQLGQHQRAINDYDEVIRLAPRFADALNNRADAYLKMGKPLQALPDVERALTIAPQTPVYSTTRGQIGQALGDRQGAVRDHEMAMGLGGTRYIRYYQCGLRLAKFYNGPIDGVLRPELRTALRLCVEKGKDCDPVPEPVNAECPDAVV